MSEPVIKPTTRMCSGCGHTELVDAFGQPWLHCSFCDADTDPLFGPDDLVRVAMALLVPFVPADGLQKAAEAVGVAMNVCPLSSTS